MCDDGLVADGAHIDRAYSKLTTEAQKASGRFNVAGFGPSQKVNVETRRDGERHCAYMREDQKVRCGVGERHHRGAGNRAAWADEIRLELDACDQFVVGDRDDFGKR